MTGATWMETGTEPVFAAEGFTSPKVETYKRYDRAETVMEVRFRNGLAAQAALPERLYDQREAQGIIRKKLDAFLSEVDSCAREDRDW